LKRGVYRLSVLDEVQALLDIPVAPYFAQFDRIYPDAKFILTTRPTESWLKSVETHFRLYVERRPDPFTDHVHACTYGALHFSRDRFEYVKARHEEDVRRHFAGRPGKLLVFDVFRGDSWPELCSFLGLPVPAEPYPHENPARVSPASVHRRSLAGRIAHRFGRRGGGR
jgi:sulfotransferase family protein